MSDQTEKVACPKHGKSYATFVCQHLAHGSNRGFFCFNEDKDDPRPDAWCRECDDLVYKDGGWNDENEKFAGITILCGGCYDEVKLRNLSDSQDL